MKLMTAKYPGTCAETGKPFKAGAPIAYSPKEKKAYCEDSKTYRAAATEPRPPKRPKYWDGHSRSGQAWEAEHFKFEMDMADKYDPADPHGYYDHL